MQSKVLVTDGGRQLPIEIIQHIQSLLDDDEAACRTSLLSKSWYAAWSTGPVLYFVEHSRFCKTTFWDFVTKKIQKYRDLNIVKIDKLVLEIDSDNKTEYDDDDECYYTSLVDKLIDDALSLRVKVLDLCFDGILRYSYAIRPNVFSHKYLTQLCLARCKVHCLGKVLCSDLAYLTLEDVSIYESSFKNILAGCPKIEYLHLYKGVKALKRVNASELQNLNALIVSMYVLRSTSGICGKFLNLRRLELDHIIVHTPFLENFSSNFPNLEDLTLEELDYPIGNGDIRISSQSIKRLTLKHSELNVLAYFIVPNIEKFKFIGRHTPRLSFTASSNEWKSKIIFSKDWLENGPFNLSRLRELLFQLRHSKITLRLNRNVVPEINIENFDLPGVGRFAYALEYCPAFKLFVECLLIFRPKLVCLSANKKAIQFLYKKLIEHSNPNNFVNNLKEVSVELYEESLKEWLWQNVKALSPQDLEILNVKRRRFRFRLKWESVVAKYTIIEFVKG